MKVKSLIAALQLMPPEDEMHFIFRNSAGKIYLDLVGMGVSKDINIKDADPTTGRPLEIEVVEESERRCKMIFEA